MRVRKNHGPHPHDSFRLSGLSDNHAHGLEDLGAFIHAIPLKSRFGNFSPIFVTRRTVKLPKPAFVFLTRSADIHAFGGRLRR